MNYIAENRNMSLLDAYNASKVRAEKKACCDFAFHTIVSHYDEKVAKDMEVLAKEKGINSFKVFMAYKDWMMNDESMIKVFKKCNSATFQIGGATYTIGKITLMKLNQLFTVNTCLRISI